MPFGGVKDSGWGRFGARPRSTSSPSCTGSRSGAARIRSRSDGAGAAMAEIVSLAEAVGSFVHDGDVVALEGFTHLIPHAAGHELIRQGRRELTLVRMTPDVVYDQLIGMGCAASSSSRGAATRASARCTGCATPSSTAGRRRSSSRSTPTRAWRPRMRPARRTSRSASCAATRAPTSRRAHGVARVDAARSRASGSPPCRHSDPTSASSTRSRPTGGQRPAVGHHRRAEGGRPRRASARS